MKVSLIVGTIGRTDELQRLLESLARQTYKDFEVIVIDQNSDVKVVGDLLIPFAALFEIKHLRSTPGLSHARNVGLQSVAGQIVAFPDDDCVYPEYVLSDVAELFQAAPNCDGFVGRSITAEGAYSGPGADRRRANEPLTRERPWGAISYTIFLRHSVIRAVGPFDEQLGVGAGTTWGSGEETDYLIRAVDRNFVIRHQPQLEVIHPRKEPSTDARGLRAAYAYGRGQGYVLRKHRVAWVPSLVRVGLPAVRSCVAAMSFQWGRARYFHQHFIGRLTGWRGLS
jgi:glycosyltransferase involved in cell wall biosynthesis